MSQLTKNDLDWAVRRLPGKTAKLMRERPNRLFLAGGFIRSIITGEKIQDIDLFAPSQAEARDAALMYSAEVVKDSVQDIVVVNEKSIYETENAYTVKGTRPMVQFIHRWTFDSPAAAIQSFDFTIAKAAIWHNGTAWTSVCHPDYYADLAGKRLVYTSPEREEAPGGNLLRVLKFYQRGYRIPLESLAAVIARLVNAIDFSKVSENDPKVISKYGPFANKEEALAFVLSGLLREVDPNVDPDAVQPLAGDPEQKEESPNE